MEQSGLTDTEAFLHALWLVDNRLVDSRCSPHSHSNTPTETMFRIRMHALGRPDERLVQRTIECFLKQPPSLSSCIDRLCKTVCDPHHGLPLVRATLLSRRLIRVIDPDILICVCHTFRPANADCYDWNAIPLRSADGAEPVLKDGSVDTHIHLGGALPSLFYWLALMSCETPVNMMVPFTEARGYASRNDWISALTRALQLRYRLALFLNDQSKLGATAFFSLGDLTYRSTAQWEDNE